MKTEKFIPSEFSQPKEVDTEYEIVIPIKDYQKLERQAKIGRYTEKALEIGYIKVDCFLYTAEQLVEWGEYREAENE